MSDDKTNNVIQFPGRRKEEPKPETTPKAKAPRRRKTSKKTLAGTVLAIILATGAVNRYAFDSSQNLTLASNGDIQRGIASTEKSGYARDAKWEKDLAERLASPVVREIASTRIGRPATMEERLRLGTLEDKYSFNYQAENQRIQTIFLQDNETNPSYVLDREKFLKEYGLLFELDFKAAKLKSVESNNEKTMESYTIFDSTDRARGEARFELDRHKRLISLKVEPVQI